MKRILLPTSMLVALAVAAPAQAEPGQGVATVATPPAVAVVPNPVPAAPPEAAVVVTPGLGMRLSTANRARLEPGRPPIGRSLPRCERSGSTSACT